MFPHKEDLAFTELATENLHGKRHYVTPDGLKFPSVTSVTSLAIRDGIKKFSNWPTIPQLYVKEEFIGGCDIIKDMFEKGDLQKTLKEKNIPYKEN